MNTIDQHTDNFDITLWTREVEYCMAQTQLRHQNSFSRLYDLTSPKLYGLVLKIVGDEASAADVLQESYTKIWHKCHNYRPDVASAWAWMCQLTRHNAIDLIRKRSRQREDIGLEQTEQFSIDSQSIWPQQMDLDRCFENIKVEQKNAILTAYIYGRSHAELANQFKIPLGTLKSWIRRGLMELKLCLEA